MYGLLWFYWGREGSAKTLFSSTYFYLEFWNGPYLSFSHSFPETKNIYICCPHGFHTHLQLQIYCIFLGDGAGEEMFQGEVRSVFINLQVVHVTIFFQFHIIGSSWNPVPINRNSVWLSIIQILARFVNSGVNRLANISKIITFLCIFQGILNNCDIFWNWYRWIVVSYLPSLCKRPTKALYFRSDMH